MPTIEDALALAAQAHRGERHHGTEPYILHVVRVLANTLALQRAEGGGDTETEQLCAALHDVIEKSEFTLDDLRAAGYSAAVIEAVDALTHRDDEPWADYIERVLANASARRVKRADLLDNMDIGRGDDETVLDLERLSRYRYAWNRLTTWDT